MNPRSILVYTNAILMVCLILQWIFMIDITHSLQSFENSPDLKTAALLSTTLLSSFSLSIYVLLSNKGMAFLIAGGASVVSIVICATIWGAGFFLGFFGPPLIGSIVVAVWGGYKKGSGNNYAYVGNNPLRFTDSEGLTATTAGGMIGGPTGAAVGSGIGSLIGVGGYLIFQQCNSTPNPSPACDPPSQRSQVGCASRTLSD